MLCLTGFEEGDKMAIANRYRVKDGASIEGILSNGFNPGYTFVNKNAYLCKHKLFHYKDLEFTIYVSFPKDLTQFDDFDYVLVLDEDFAQPYTPFYNSFGKDVKHEYVAAVIEAYNNFMNSIPVLEQKNKFCPMFGREL